jgi:hypothetical protein
MIGVPLTIITSRFNFLMAAIHSESFTEDIFSSFLSNIGSVQSL